MLHLLLLGLFHAQHVHQKHSSQGAPCSAFTLWTVLQHTILMLQKQSQPSKSLNKGRSNSYYFLGVADHLDVLAWSDPLITTQVNLSNHSFRPDYQAQQSYSCHFSHFACPPFLEGYTSPDTFFSLTFIKERILCKIICHPVTKGRKHVCRSGLFHFNSSDLNSKHLRLSAQGFFLLVSLCSCIRMEKKLVLSLS